MQALFKLTNIALAMSLVVSAAGHILLLASDSSQYRMFVSIQIAIQLTACIAIWGIQKFRISALFCFVLLSIAFFLINGIYINYGNLTLHLVVFIIFWGLYASLLYTVKGSFRLKSA